MRAMPTIVATLLVAVPPAVAQNAGGVAATTREASATLTGADGAEHGTLRLREDRGGVRISGRILNVAPGRYAIHVHEVGRCDAPAFTSAGEHWNPTDAAHGAAAAGGPHKGDMPNIVVRASRTGEVNARLPGVSLGGARLPVLDADGSAVILHTTADDYRSQPSGDAGGRMACGVVRPR